MTNNIPARVKAHNSEKYGAKYTRKRQPVHLVYVSGPFATKSLVMKEEYRIKRKVYKPEKESMVRVWQTTHPGGIDDLQL
jgi:predicted GIY-YIG superfamily endonuclease